LSPQRWSDLTADIFDALEQIMALPDEMRAERRITIEIADFNEPMEFSW